MTCQDAVQRAPSKLLTTGENWKALVERIRFGHLIPTFKIRVIDADAPLGVMLVVWRYPYDALGSKSSSIAIEIAYKVPSAATEEHEACIYIRDLIAGNLAHEVAEHFRLDDVRIFDPHAAVAS